MGLQTLRRTRIRHKGDAVRVIRGVVNGRLKECPKRLTTADQDSVSSGDIFVFKINGKSGIKRWTDPFTARTGSWKSRELKTSSAHMHPMIRKKYKLDIVDVKTEHRETWIAVAFDYHSDAHSCLTLRTVNQVEELQEHATNCWMPRRETTQDCAPAFQHQDNLNKNRAACENNHLGDLALATRGNLASRTADDARVCKLFQVDSSVTLNLL